MSQTELETARLRLRPITPDDEADLHRLFSDPEVMRYLSGGKVRTREESAAATAEAVAHWARHGHGIWAVIQRTTGQFVGRCGLRFLEDIGQTELLYTLGRAFWGQGLATEAGAAALAFGFERCGLERIIALALPEHVASRRVMEKLGLRYERRAPFRGFETVWYALDRSDFLRRAGHPFPNP
jgi:ribosomal-protein-alanine N-acetyltransferase